MSFSRGPEADEPLDLPPLIVRPKVDVQAILDHLRVWVLEEEEARIALAEVEPPPHAVLAPHQRPRERGAPELSDPLRVEAVDHNRGYA